MTGRVGIPLGRGGRWFPRPLVWPGSLAVLFVLAAALPFCVGRGEDTAESFYEMPKWPQSICGPAAVVNLCALRGVETDLSAVQPWMPRTRGPVSVQACLDALQAMGVPCEHRSFASVMELPELTPCFCVLRVREGLHAVVIVRKGEGALVIDGGQTEEMSVSSLDRVSVHTALVPR